MKRSRLKMPASLAKLAPTTIRDKLTLWFLFLSLAPVFATALLAYTISRASLQTEIYNKLDAVADNKSYSIGKLFKDQLSEAAALTANDALKDLLSPSFRIVYPDLAAKTDAERVRRVKDIITARQETNTSYLDVMIADPEGTIVASSSKSLLQQGKNLKDLGAPGIPEGDTFHITQAFFSKAAQLHVMMILQPIHDNNAKIIGRVALEVDLRPVARLIEERSGLGESGEVIIVDKGRRMLTPSRFSEEVLKPVPDSKPISLGLQDQKGHDISNDYRGVPVIAAYRPLPEIGAALIAKIDRSEGLAPIIQLRNIMGIIGPLTLFFPRPRPPPPHHPPAGKRERRLRPAGRPGRLNRKPPRPRRLRDRPALHVPQPHGRRPKPDRPAHHRDGPEHQLRRLPDLGRRRAAGENRSLPGRVHQRGHHHHPGISPVLQPGRQDRRRHGLGVERSQPHDRRRQQSGKAWHRRDAPLERPGPGGGQEHPKLKRADPPDQLHRPHRLQHRRADQHAGVKRRHRSGPSRRERQGVRRRRHGGKETRRPEPESGPADRGDHPGDPDRHPDDHPGGGGGEQGSGRGSQADLPGGRDLRRRHQDDQADDGLGAGDHAGDPPAGDRRGPGLRRHAGDRSGDERDGGGDQRDK